MELRIDRTKLYNSLSHVHQVAERKNTVEILRNVLLECQNGQLKATATDIDTTLCETIDCLIDQTGEKTVSASMLHDIVRSLPDGAEIKMSDQGDNPDTLEITVGRSLFRLASLPKSEFPAVDEFTVEHQFTIAGSALLALIRNTLFAAAVSSEVRYYLNGIFLHYHADSNTLRAVATNSHLLARHEVEPPVGCESMSEGVILPRKALSELSRLLENTTKSEAADDAEGENSHAPQVLIEIGQANARMTLGNVVLSCKLIAGKYPDYERVVPDLAGDPLEIHAKGFFDGVKRVSTISNVTQNKGVKFCLKSDGLVLEAVDQDSNLGQEEIQFQHALTPMEVGFNASYLASIGSLIRGDSVQFWFPRNNGPVVIRNPEVPAGLFVLMPMRV